VSRRQSNLSEQLFGAGSEPDAVNFWFGDGRAVTSCKYHC